MSHTFYLFVLTEPKGTMGYQFIEPWIGKTALPFFYCIFWFITVWLFVKLGSLTVTDTHTVCLCLQVTGYCCRKDQSGFGPEGSWPQLSIMMFWNHTLNWRQTLLKLCWYVHFKITIYTKWTIMLKLLHFVSKWVKLMSVLEFIISCRDVTSVLSLLGQMEGFRNHKWVIWIVWTREPYDSRHHLEVCF